MGKFIIRRISTGILVLFFVITITFVLSRVVPSDPAAKWVGAHATHEQKAAAIIALVLDCTNVANSICHKAWLATPFRADGYYDKHFKPNPIHIRFANARLCADRELDGS